MAIEEHLLEEFADETKLSIPRRRSLLPIWMKIFTWFFMLVGSICVPLLVLGMLGLNFRVALYGLDSSDPKSFAGLLVLRLFIYKGLVSIALWFEMKWAAVAGIVDAILGILICFSTMFAAGLFPGNQSGLSFRLEIIFLAIYLVKLLRIRKKWNLSLGRT